MENGLMTDDEAFAMFADLTDEEVLGRIKDDQDDEAMCYLISKY